MRNSEKTLRSKYLLYEPYTVNQEDPIIQGYIAKSLHEFGSEPDDVKIRINLEIV
jgi:hypothetical protein